LLARCIFPAILAALFDLTPTVKIALLLMAVSLVPAIFPRKRLKLGGRANCVFGCWSRHRCARSGLSIIWSIAISLLASIRRLK
jgi:hypothetical protein